MNVKAFSRNHQYQLINVIFKSGEGNVQDYESYQ